MSVSMEERIHHGDNLDRVEEVHGLAATQEIGATT